MILQCTITTPLGVSTTINRRSPSKIRPKQLTLKAELGGLAHGHKHCGERRGHSGARSLHRSPRYRTRDEHQEHDAGDDFSSPPCPCGSRRCSHSRGTPSPSGEPRLHQRAVGRGDSVIESVIMLLLPLESAINLRKADRRQQRRRCSQPKGSERPGQRRRRQEVARRPSGQGRRW